MHLRLFAANPTHKANAAANSVDAHVSGHCKQTPHKITEKQNGKNNFIYLADT
jgi:hypothetical protein